nr:MAG TPA: hypothetical protein [Caudoviricetes sp.]
MTLAPNRLILCAKLALLCANLCDQTSDFIHFGTLECYGTVLILH